MQFLKKQWTRFKRWWKHALITTGIIGVAMAMGAPTGTLDTPTEIRQAQEAYFQQHGEYLQVLPENKLPPYKTGEVADYLGADVAPEFRVDIYETPASENANPRARQGYQIRWEDTDYKYSVATGTEKSTREYQIQKPKATTSTTTFVPDFSVLVRLFTPLKAFAALTENTHATDLEDGSSQKWSITDANQTGLDITDDITIYFNIKPESLTGNHTVVSKWGTNKAYVFWVSSNGCEFFGDDGSTQDGALVSFSFSAGTYYEVVGTIDNSTNTFECWVNGTSQGTDTQDTNGFADVNADFEIGGQDDDQQYYDGLIDDVRVWSRLLSDTEIGNLTDDPCTFDNGASLQGWWLFDNDGTDETANGNDLTNNNSATFSTDVAYECAGVVGPAAPEPTTVNWWQ